jgi:hypothetical protein
MMLLQQQLRKFLVKLKEKIDASRRFETDPIHYDNRSQEVFLKQKLYT